MSVQPQMEFHGHSQHKHSPSSKLTSSAARVTQPHREELATTIAQPDMGENIDYVFQLSCKSLKDNRNMPLRLDRHIDTNFERLLQVAAATVAHVAQTCNTTRKGIKCTSRLC